MGGHCLWRLSIDKVRVEIVGSQFAAPLHLNNYRKLRGSKMEIVAYASKAEKNAQETARKFEIASILTDHQELWESEAPCASARGILTTSAKPAEAYPLG